MQNKAIETELDAWLMFLSSDSPERVVELITAYPEFKAMYESLYSMCLNTERVMEMFSEELQKLDRNTVQYMIDEQQKQIDAQFQQLIEQNEQLIEQNEQLSVQGQKLTEQREQLSVQAQKLAEQSEQLYSQKQLLKEKELELEALRKKLEESRR